MQPRRRCHCWHAFPSGVRTFNSSCNLEVRRRSICPPHSRPKRTLEKLHGCSKGKAGALGGNPRNICAATVGTSACFSLMPSLCPSLAALYLLGVHRRGRKGGKALRRSAGDSRDPLEPAECTFVRLLGCCFYSYVLRIEIRGASKNRIERRYCAVPWDDKLLR